MDENEEGGRNADRNSTPKRSSTMCVTFGWRAGFAPHPQDDAPSRPPLRPAIRPAPPLHFGVAALGGATVQITTELKWKTIRRGIFCNLMLL